jgi:hypothetical protein
VKTSTTILSRIAADPGKLALAIAFGLALGYLGGLFRLSMSHDLILDPRGRPVLSDFVAFWTAGHEALRGVLVYDLTVLAVAGVFLFRQREFDHFELFVLASMLPPCVLLVYLVPVPTAFLATVAMTAIAVRRALAWHLAAPQLSVILPQHFTRVP